MDSHTGNIEQSGVDWAYIIYRQYRVHICMQLWDVDSELWCYLILSQFISYVSVDYLPVLQETTMSIFTRQTFNSWAALSFDASRLIDNKLACDRVVTNFSDNCSMCITKLTGYSYSWVMKEGNYNELHGTEHFQLWTVLAIRWLVLTRWSCHGELRGRLVAWVLG